MQQLDTLKTELAVSECVLVHMYVNQCIEIVKC